LGLRAESTGIDFGMMKGVIAGICPEALAALIEANQGHEVGYGDDTWTDKAANLLRKVFETDCEVFFVFNGTAANALAPCN
jgi:threonine aldolase